MTYEVIIVGAGASGTFAAMQLRGKKVLVVDVGNTPSAGAAALQGNLYDLRRAREEMHDELIGEAYESLHNISHEYLSPKLKAPLLRYVVDETAALSPIVSDGFYTVTSHARGGMANAWGAGVFPFTDRELKGFPITASDLAPYYRALTEHIGISGTTDDLAADFPDNGALQPPLALSRIGTDLLSRYEQRRSAVQRRGIRIGRSRLAVLTREHHGRAACEYDNLEFFKPHIPAVYNPAYTLDELVRDGQIDYRPRSLALSYEEREDGVALRVRDLTTQTEHTVTAKKIVIAAGTLNSSRLVLRSRNDLSARLPLLDNKISYVPFLQPWLIGGALEEKSFATAQLSVVYERDPAPLFSTFYGLTGPLRSDYLLKFPLTLRDNIAAAKYLSPAMAIVQVFYPDVPHPENHVSLNAGGALQIAYGRQEAELIERELIRAFLRLGYFSHPSLCQFPTAGNSFHYAGTLPMQREPGPYQTHASGRLSDTRHVYIADGAALTWLPSKNLTFTLMANAMRVADHVRKDLGG
ncbi:MAG: GMC family oxidoreductase [Deltaproteobacteria bacterium]|nr:GMC family oxidoreductase [Deltaproteobacteria bacterium]